MSRLAFSSEVSSAMLAISQCWVSLPYSDLFSPKRAGPKQAKSSVDASTIVLRKAAARPLHSTCILTVSAANERCKWFTWPGPKFLIQPALWATVVENSFQLKYPVPYLLSGPSIPALWIPGLLSFSPDPTKRAATTPTKTRHC